MAIDTTPGGVSADGYVSLADAEAYHANRADNAAWDAATDPDKETAIKNATMLLDLLDWKGTKEYDTGALRWPRDGVYDRDGLALDATAIPTFLERATAEWAFVLLRDGDTSAAPGSAGLSGLKVDVIELQFDTSQTSDSQKPQGTPDSVQQMIAFYLAGSAFAMKVVRT